MEVTLADQRVVFRPWRPTAGRVFSEVYAFDSETTLINEDSPWITPAYVIGAALNGQHGVFIPRNFVKAFFRAHRDIPVAMHNASFDLAVVQVLCGDWDLSLIHI